MKRSQIFTELLSPLSWVALYAGFAPMMIIVFHPSIWEFLAFMAVDLTTLIVATAVDRRLFQAIWPETALYFPTFDPKDYENKTTDERLAVFESMSLFPQRRGLFVFIVSYLKLIPALLVITFYWEHENSNILQALTTVAVFSPMYFYFYGALYFEFHQRVSTIIAQLHAEQDWTEVFRKAPTPASSHFDRTQMLSVTAIWALIAFTQSMILAGAESRPSSLAAEIVVVSLNGLILFSRLWYLERNYFLGGLRAIFKSLETYSPEARHNNLALHSSPILAHFEQTFNGLMDRLRANEQELSHWIFSVSEQSRFRALGETSGLVVHDLGTPLQVVAFCTDQLIEDPDRIRNPRYVEQLRQNAYRALDLIRSWRAYLKNQSSSGQNHSLLSEALDHAVRLLSTQFEPYVFNSVKISSEKQLEALTLAIPRAELIHVLVNLLTNSFNNLIQNEVPEAVITIELSEKNTEKVVIAIKDNGTGLKADAFERITAYDFLPQNGEKTRSGMGLRLVRRLLEQNGGDLRAVDVPKGTCLLLTVKNIADGATEKQNGS